MSSSNRLFHTLVVVGASLTGASTGCGGPSQVDGKAAQDAVADGAGGSGSATGASSGAASGRYGTISGTGAISGYGNIGSGTESGYAHIMAPCTFVGTSSGCSYGIISVSPSPFDASNVSVDVGDAGTDATADGGGSPFDAYPFISPDAGQPPTDAADKDGTYPSILVH